MWKRLNIIFSLKSPLHIGYLPKKGSMVAPTRHYILGKNFWGAITKKTTEHLYTKPKSKDYFEVGKQIKENFRFGYFYIYDHEKRIYLPTYSKNGLIYGHRNNENIDVMKFERKFTGSRVLTAIETGNRTAKEASLHEINFIIDKYRDENENIRNTKIIGCIWIRKDCQINNKTIVSNNEGIFIGEFNLIEKLTLGGEQNYGFGCVNLEGITKEKILIRDEKTDTEEIKIEIRKNESILYHFKYNESVSFQGDIELLVGRAYFDIKKTKISKKANFGYKEKPGSVISKGIYCFTPGTIIDFENKDKTIEATLQWNGIITL